MLVCSQKYQWHDFNLNDEINDQNLRQNRNPQKY